jgi:hypothetical protein
MGTDGPRHPDQQPGRASVRARAILVACRLEKPCPHPFLADYVSRVCRKLNVSSRVELIVALRKAQDRTP